MSRADSISEPSIRSTPSSWLPATLTAAVVLPLVAVSQFIAHLNDAVLDDHLFGYFGWRLSEGASLYRDVWDHKPPGMFWINALGFLVSGGTYAGVVVLCVITQFVTLALFFVAANRLYRRGTGALLTIFAAVYLTHSRFFGGGNRSETYLAAFEMAFVVFYLAGWRRDRSWCWLAAGISGGMALLVKQTGFAAMAAALFHLVVLAFIGKLSFATFRRRAGLIAAGAGSIVLACVGILAVQGVLTDAWQAMVSANRVYLSIDHSGMGENTWWIRLQNSELALLKLPIILALATLARAVARSWMRRPSGEDEHGFIQACPSGLTFLGIWLFLSLSGPIVGPLASPHYMQPVTPPLLLFGGAFVNSLLLETGLLDTLRRKALTVLLLIIAVYFGGDAVVEQCQKASIVYWARRPQFENGRFIVEPTAAERIGEEIRRRTKPEDRIQCWDYLPGVCLAARRATTSRFPDHLRAEWAAQAGIGRPEEFVEALQSAPPAMIVMGSRSERQLAHLADDETVDTQRAARFILDHYRPMPELTRENIMVLRRRESLRSPPG